MTDAWLSTVTHTYVLGSQRGGEAPFDDQINAFLRLGWRIINTYVEDKGPESTREECVCLMGWTGGSVPEFPDDARAASQ